MGNARTLHATSLHWYGWQPRFYDEIIRNGERLEQIRVYILNNPANWKTDQNNPANIGNITKQP